jgi:hypothetical protein
VVFLNSPRREMPKNVIKKEIEEELTSKFLSVSLGKVFDMRHGIFVKTFYVVFLNSTYYREAPKKNAITKKARKRSWQVAGAWL